MRRDRGLVWELVIGVTLLLCTSWIAYTLYAVLSGGARLISPSTVAHVWGDRSPLWPTVVAGSLAVIFGLYGAVSTLRRFAEDMGLIPLDFRFLCPRRNPFARRIATAVLSNNGLMLPEFGSSHIAGDGVSQLFEFHGKVGSAGIETALKELHGRLKAPGWFSRRPILLLQVVSADDEQISTDMLDWVTSCALREGFASVKTLTGLGRALTEDEFSRMARVLS